MTMSVSPTKHRIHGLDVARALAMIGMVIAHYVESASGAGLGAEVRSFVDGRAMPLFMVLGGVGVSFLVRRSSEPDRDLLLRASILFPMGLILQELTDGIAIILQYYALFFVLAVGLRRLPDRLLLVSAVAAAVIGAYTKQVFAPELTSYAGWAGLGSLAEPGLWWSLVITGYYPFFPGGAFFLIGMWLGRLDLGRPRMDATMAIAGITLAVLGSWVGAWIGDEAGASGVVIAADGSATLADDLVDRYAASEGLSPDEAAARIEADFPPGAVDGLEQLADRVERTTPGFRWARLFDAEGHSQMPAWVLGATGTALLAIGVSLMAARRFRLAPLAVLGEMALTFYAFQAIAINWTPDRSTTTLAEENLIAAGLTLSFLLLALAWKSTVGRGPLEQLLRVGAAPRVVAEQV